MYAGHLHAARGDTARGVMAAAAILVIIILASLVIIYIALDRQSHASEPYFPTVLVQPDMWQVGGALQVGDSYEYRICHDAHIIQEIHPDVCYSVHLDFIYHMAHHAYGPVWVADVNFDDRRRTLLLIDTEMRVHPTSGWDRLLALSIESTIFEMAKYGKQQLAVGAHWADVKTYFHTLPLAVTFVGYHHGDDNHNGSKNNRTHTATLRYGEHSVLLVQNNLAFPAYGKWYDPMTISSVPEPVIKYEYVLLKVNGHTIPSLQ